MENLGIALGINTSFDGQLHHARMVIGDLCTCIKILVHYVRSISTRTFELVTLEANVEHIVVV